MASMESCCTCATVISDVQSAPSPAVLCTKTEKQIPTAQDRRLDCCLRVICGRCIDTNPRFAEYCPYCQIATSPSNPLPSGLREPPSYEFATGVLKGSRKTSAAAAITTGAAPAPAASIPPPPPYAPRGSTTTTTNNTHHVSEKPTSAQQEDPKPAPAPAPDTLHFLHPTDDTIASLSLRYRVPASVLRRYNNLTSDHLVSARKTILIPGSHYPAGVSLSPRPVEGEQEEARKAKIRRWMVACKCAEYDVAELYLGQADYDLGVAVERFLADEEWERRNPLECRAKNKKSGDAGASATRRFGRAGTWASQAVLSRGQGSG